MIFAYKKIDFSFGRAHLCADGRRESEAHGAESAGRYDASGRSVAEIACGKHLVLTDVVDEYGVFAGRFAHQARCLAHGRRFVGVGAVGRFFNDKAPLVGVVAVESRHPFLAARFVDERNQSFDSFPRIGMDAQIDRYVFVELALVDVDMHDLGLRGIMFRDARDTVVETHPYGHDQIGAVRVDIRAEIAMHSEHTFEKPVV